MLATINLDTAANNLNAQSDLKAAEIEESIYYDYQCNDKHRSSHPMSPFTTTLCKGIISKKYERAKYYKAKRFSIETFQVAFNEFNEVYEFDEISESAEDDVMLAKIRLFKRVRVVTINENGIMKCLCCEYEVCSLFCEHQIYVTKLIYKALGETFEGFDHHDSALRWISVYMHLAFCSDTPKSLQLLFDNLLDSGDIGPRLKIQIHDSIGVEEPWEDQPAIDRIKNYQKEHAIVPKNYFDGLYISELVQECHKNLDSLFAESIDNYELPVDVVSNAREILKDKVSITYQMADRLGKRGVEGLECVPENFMTCANKQYEDLSDDNISIESGVEEKTMKTTKFIPMMQDSYTCSVKRIYNTKHM